MTAAERAARREVDRVHLVASRSENPVAVVRAAQASAEADWARFGDRASLALVVAFRDSLDAP